MNNENEITKNEKICPSCDGIIEHDEHIDNKKLCFYCYMRSNLGTSKFLLFKSMIDNGNEFKTVKEITKDVNKLRKSLDKPEIKDDTVYRILHRYSMFYEQNKKKKAHYLVLVQKVKPRKKKGQKKNVGGRPTHKFKLSKRLIDRTKRMEFRWMNGMPINSKINKGKSFKFNTAYMRKSKVIANKIKKGDYKPYTYMLPDTY